MQEGIVTFSIIWLIIRSFTLLRNKKYKSISMTRELLFNSFVIYCIAVVVVVFPDLHQIGMISLHPSINLVPFVDIINNFQINTFPLAFKLKLLFTNLLGNLVLLLPLGIFLPMLWARFRSLKRTIRFGAIVSLTIEVMQVLPSFLGLRGRIADIDDLILNSLGVLIGYFIYHKIFVRFNLVSRFEHVSSFHGQEEAH